jgi:hypothetical protein
VYQVGIAYHEITSRWYTVNKTLNLKIIQLSRNKIQLHCCYINHQMPIFVSGKVYGYTFRLVLDVRKPIQNIQVSFITSVGESFFFFWCTSLI